MDVELSIWEADFREKMDEAYFKKNDRAHQIDHIDNVWKNMVNLVNRSNLKHYFKRDILFLAVYMHDMYCWVDRKNHNILVADLLEKKEYGKVTELSVLSYMFDNEIETIKEMVLWHRSSMKIEEYVPGENDNLAYINLIRHADKGAPKFKPWLERSMKYHENDDNQIECVRNHFIKKFSKDGYAWKNDPGYKNAYPKEYGQFQIDLEKWLEETA